MAMLAGNEITRIFHVPERGDVLVVVHSPLTGMVDVTLNGLHEAAILESPGVYWFAKRAAATGETQKYVVRISSTSNWLSQATGIGASYSYALQVNGREVQENNDRAMAGGEGEVESASGLRITNRVCGGGGAQTQWYLVEWPERNVHVHRRYTEFAHLHAQILSAFRGTQLYGSVPDLPPKEGLAALALSPKQLAANSAFLTTRQTQLEGFLKRVAVFPGVGFGRNPDFLDFLGVSARGLVEHSTVFEDGPVGLKLKQMAKDAKNAFAAQVCDVVPDSQASKFLSVGDVIYKVGGEAAFDYEQISRQLASAELRPIVVHFLCCNLVGKQ